MDNAIGVRQERNSGNKYLDVENAVRGMVGIIPAGERDSVEEYHRHLVEKYDSVE